LRFGGTCLGRVDWSDFHLRYVTQLDPRESVELILCQRCMISPKSIFTELVLYGMIPWIWAGIVLKSVRHFFGNSIDRHRRADDEYERLDRNRYQWRLDTKKSQSGRSLGLPSTGETYDFLSDADFNSATALSANVR